MSLLKKISTTLILVSIVTSNLVPTLTTYASEIKKPIAQGRFYLKNFTESDVLNYDELIAMVSEKENMTIEEAKKFIGPEKIIKDSSGKATRATYRTYHSSVWIASNYSAYPTFYCETSEWGNYRGIVKILNSSLNRNHNGSSNQFSGTLYINLENANTIYYELNGDFFNNGTTTVSGGANIGVGQSGTLSFSLSYASNHFKYINKYDRFYLNRP
ncbi:MAG: hypothetical protein ACRCVJ_08075 [Clostridium sp.]|uniref:hypothetical protein n=1 Tax=Clostridium sp. TaxID=1506 RepID=UPI003F381663